MHCLWQTKSQQLCRKDGVLVSEPHKSILNPFNLKISDKNYIKLY
jgi:intein-encoded DNA endonuclease-like protein